jgi:hypothetical protein
MPHRSTSLTGVIIFAAEVCRINGTSSKTTLFYLLRLGVGDNSAPRTASYTIYLTPWLVGYLLLLDLRSTNKLARDHPMIANNILFHYYFLTMTNLWASPLWPLQPQFEQTIGESSAARNSLCLLILFWPTWLPWRDKRWLCNTIVFDAIQTDREDVSLESILDIPKRLILVN